MTTRSRPKRLRFLNQPRHVQVLEQDGRPIALVAHSRKIAVEDCHETWRIDDEWWRSKPISRVYWRISLSDGRMFDIYHDLVTGEWFSQAYG